MKEIHTEQSPKTCLTVISDSWLEAGRSRVRVRCECGTEFCVTVNSFRTGNTTSCGCKRKRSLLERNTTHGMAKRSGRHPLYRTWSNIIQRCTKKNNPKFSDYGGRGIVVCERWRGSFELFLQDVGERPFASAELDRKNNDGNYEPGNVQWATRKEQTRNTRRNHLLAHNGITKTLTDWADVLGWSFMGLHRRVARMPLSQAMIENPKRKRST